MNNNFVSHFKGKNQKEVKALIVKALENQEQQLALKEKLLLPDRNCIKVGNRVLKNELPISAFVESKERAKKYFEESMIAYSKFEGCF